MLNRLLTTVVAILLLGANSYFADDPIIEVFEKRTPTGVLQEKFQYYLKDGVKVKHGLCSIHYRNGQVLTSATYKHGQRHGPMKSYYQWINKLSYEADTIARAIGHIVDQPWLVNDEVEINKEFYREKRQRERKHAEREDAKEDFKGVPFVKPQSLPGRESFGLYYPSADYELRDSDDNLWWNANPTSWHGTNDDRYNKTTMPFGVGSVYPFFVSQYPESKRSDGKSAGWKSGGR